MSSFPAPFCESLKRASYSAKLYREWQNSVTSQMSLSLSLMVSYKPSYENAMWFAGVRGNTNLLLQNPDAYSWSPDCIHRRSNLCSVFVSENMDHSGTSIRRSFNIEQMYMSTFTSAMPCPGAHRAGTSAHDLAHVPSVHRTTVILLRWRHVQHVPPAPHRRTSDQGSLGKGIAHRMMTAAILKTVDNGLKLYCVFLFLSRWCYADKIYNKALLLAVYILKWECCSELKKTLAELSLLNNTFPV